MHNSVSLTDRAAIFLAFAQNSGITQAIAFILIEAGALIGACVLRPWMDKSTNSFNITIFVVNFLNALCLLIFVNVFGQPALANGVVGVVFWILNAAVTLVLLLMLIVSTVVVFMQDNPDARYKVMLDDRTSFLKSSSQLARSHLELDALGAAARGEKPGYSRSHLDLDEEPANDDESILSDMRGRRRLDPSGYPLPPSTAGSMRSMRNTSPRSPVDPSLPFLPADARNSPRRPPGQRSVEFLRTQRSGNLRTPSPLGSSMSGAMMGGRTVTPSSPAAIRAQNNAR